MAYILKFGKRFDREFSKLDKSLSDQVVKKLNRLKENPENVEKPLFYTKPTLWEFKIEMFHIFYIIQKNISEVWLPPIRHKDETEKYIREAYRIDINEF